MWVYQILISREETLCALFLLDYVQEISKKMSETSSAVQDLIKYVPYVAVLAGISYGAYRLIAPKGHINPNIQKSNSKVVDIINIEDIGDSIALCRCWRSKEFPKCDGAHAKHNQCTGDNVGPVLIKRTK